MNTKEAYALIQTALERYNAVTSALTKGQNISAEVREQYLMCNHTLRSMGQLAFCLIENCNQTLSAAPSHGTNHGQLSNKSTVNRYNK